MPNYTYSARDMNGNMSNGVIFADDDEVTATALPEGAKNYITVAGYRRDVEMVDGF